MFAQVTLVPVITTVSGNGTHGYSGDNGVATSAVLNYPWGIAVDASGNLYFSDYESNRIRKVSSNGIITTVAGNGIGEYSGDNGLAISAGLRYPAGLAVDASGALYIADSGNYAVRKVTTDGNITTVAGTGTGGYSGDNGIARSARLSSPEGLALDASGNLYIADTFNHRIRKVSLGGIITTVAGTGTAGFFGDGGSAISAELNTPRGIVVDASGNLYIADSLNHRIRMVSTSGIISTVAGTGTAGYLGDGGPANSAELNTPYGIALDASGDLYIADFWNDLIRKVGTRSLTA
jgi:sugar lactone lactonase YvrE